MFRMITSSQSSGWMFHAGEFWNVGPSSSTRRHSTSEIMTGRRNSRAAAYSARGTAPRASSAFTVSAPFIASRDGHQVCRRVDDAARGDQRLPLAGGHLELLHRPPGLAGPVDDALTGDGDVFGALRPDRRVALTLRAALVGRAHQRVVLEPRAEQQQRAPLEVQVDRGSSARSARSGTRRGARPPAAAGLRARGDRGRDGGGVQRRAVAARAVVGDADAS